MTKPPEFIELAKSLLHIPNDKFIKVLEGKEEHQKEEWIRAKAYYDLEFFANYFFSSKDENGEWRGHTKDPFNKMHFNFFKSFDPNKRNLRKNILASRGSAKTTLIALIYAIHGICYSLEKYILILSATSPQSRKKTKDIHAEIAYTKKFKEVFDLDFESKRKTSSENFVVESIYGDCFVHSQSFNSEIRGTKYKENRPTLIILDDVVHSEEVFSEEQREKMDRRLKTDIMNTIQPGTNIINIATRLHADDLGSSLAKDPSWESEEWPAFEKWPDNMELWKEWEEIIKDPTKETKEKNILAQKFYEKNKKEMEKGAKVLWPEREPVLELMKQRLSIGPRAFDAEKQLVPFLTGESLFDNITYFYPKEVDGQYGFYIPNQDEFILYDEARFTKYYAMDPSTGEEKKQTQKKNLSKSARIIASRDQSNGRLYVIDAFMDRKAQSKIISEMYDLHHHHDFHKMFFEENLYRDVYKDTIELIGEKWNKKYSSNIKLPIHSIWNSIEKSQRIYGLDPQISMGKIIINKHINPEFMSQLQTYPNSDHNDGLDALQIMWQGINTRGFTRG